MTTTKSIVFDVETCSLPEEQLFPFLPNFEAPSNFKDPEKIRAAIDAKHKAWMDNAGLDALTGSVLVIGLMIDDAFVLISEPATESERLYEFWDSIQHTAGQLHHIIGFNVCQFDLPFMIRRSWKLGVPVPLGIRRGRYWGDNISDLRDVWQCGDRQAVGSLDSIAKHLGVGQKNGDGADFGRLWAENREQAIEYIKNDLRLTQAIAKKLGVL